MATISFIVFIIIGYLLPNILKPNSKVMIWVYSIIIPLLMLLIVVLSFGEGDTYKSGQIMGQCLISTLAMIVLMLFRLLKK